MDKPRKKHASTLGRILSWSTVLTFVVGLMLPRHSNIQMYCLLLWVVLFSLCILFGAIGIRNMR
ncbi:MULTISPECIES: hypothetical protein [Bacteroidales]|uniref:hypothetical protein n=1 Tax=Bacteroidales TaxID=171549 RepID=UPI002597E8E1|nr:MULTISPECIES: hypothetical protein [Bacteroidales]